MMKYYRHFILTLLAVVVSGAMMAQTGYGIEIAGNELNSNNASNITNANFSALTVSAGTITYDHGTHTITLNGVTASVSTGAFLKIPETAPGSVYKLVLIGDNTITNVTTNAFHFAKNTTVEGAGSLYILGGNAGLLVGSNTTVTIKDTRISAYGSMGISGTSKDNNCNLVIENSVVKAKGFYGSVSSLTSLTLTQCSIIQPENAVFENGFVKEDGGVVTSEVVIAPEATPYGINIAGTELTNINFTDINNPEVFPNLNATAGSISYDHATKTITLNGLIADITTADTYFIHIQTDAEVAEYKINLVGENIISNTNVATIFAEKNLTIEGAGKLKVTSAQHCGIFVSASNLSIKNTEVTAIGSWGIGGNVTDPAEEHLVIENSTVKATGTTGSIDDFTSITLTGCNITQPNGAAIGDNNGSKAIMLNNAVVTSEVIITPQAAGVTNVSAELPIALYPNPASNFVTVETESIGVVITITDMSGRTAMTASATGSKTMLDISHLSAGTYFVRVGNRIAKIVKN